MQGHLFEEQTERLYHILKKVHRHVMILDKLYKPSFVVSGGMAIEKALEEVIDELEIAIIDYENGITKDIDKTKAEIMQALKRL